MAKPPAKAEAEHIDPESEALAETMMPFLRPDKVEEGRQLLSMLISREHHGPLPAPETYGGYEAILPGSAERILQMAEREQEHRHKQESRMVRGEYLIRGAGQFGALAAIAILGALAAFCVWEKQPVAASVITAIGIAAAAFLRHSQQAVQAREAEPQKPPPKRHRNAKKR